MTAVPGAREVREEDAFDVARVAAWLRANAATPDGLDGEPEVRQFTGGASNLTYLLRYPSGRDLIVRRAPAGTKARGAHDMHREYVIQSALAPVFDLRRADGRLLRRRRRHRRRLLRHGPHPTA